MVIFITLVHKCEYIHGLKHYLMLGVTLSSTIGNVAAIIAPLAPAQIFFLWEKHIRNIKMHIMGSIGKNIGSIPLWG